MSEQLKHTITHILQQLNFPLIRFTGGYPEQSEIKYYKEWIAQNYHAEMSYLARDIEKRFDPRNILPGYRSMAVMILPYQQPVQPELGEYISIYAYGRDYHNLIRKRLKKVSKILKTEYNITGRGVVDSAPILERYYARKSGIGWRGKNGLILNKQFGSTFFIALLLLDCDLPYDDETISNRCGNCNRCIENCPTGAILPSGVLNCNRCLSYWSIEAKEEPPPEIEQHLHDLIFGCDRCQSICPWNQPWDQKLTAINESDLCYRYSGYTLEDLATLTEEQFLTLFAGSPIRRGGYLPFIRGVKRVIKYRNGKRNKNDTDKGKNNV